MEKNRSFKYYTLANEHQNQWNGELGPEMGDRRFAYRRQASFHQSHDPHTPISFYQNDSSKPLLSRTMSSIDMPAEPLLFEETEMPAGGRKGLRAKLSFVYLVVSFFKAIRSGNRYMKRLLWLISLNVAYSTVELAVGLITGRVGKYINLLHSRRKDSVLTLSWTCSIFLIGLTTCISNEANNRLVLSLGYRFKIHGAGIFSWIISKLQTLQCANFTASLLRCDWYLYIFKLPVSIYFRFGVRCISSNIWLWPADLLFACNGCISGEAWPIIHLWVSQNLAGEVKVRCLQGWLDDCDHPGKSIRVLFPIIFCGDFPAVNIYDLFNH